MLVIDGTAVVMFIAAVTGIYLALRATSKRRSIAKAQQAESLEELVGMIYDYAGASRDTNPGLGYIASLIELHSEQHSRKKL